jgi:four helix bundle protein
MSRDYRKLRAFQLADELVVRVYRGTADFPDRERFGLQAQLRRAAVSVPANIVEGSARRSLAEYVNYLNIATGSAAEAGYLVDLSRRLGFMPAEAHADLEPRYRRLIASLVALTNSLAVRCG